jgi:hypothetical protein
VYPLRCPIERAAVVDRTHVAIGSEEILVVIVLEPTALSRKGHKRAKVAGDGPADRAGGVLVR